MPEFRRGVESHKTWRRLEQYTNEQLPGEALASNTRGLSLVLGSFLPVVSMPSLWRGLQTGWRQQQKSSQEGDLPSKHRIVKGFILKAGVRGFGRFHWSTNDEHDQGGQKMSNSTKFFGETSS